MTRLHLPIPGLLFLALAMTSLLGCEREPAKPLARVTVPEIVLTTPEDAARSALTGLRAHLHASAQHDEHAREECLQRLDTLIAKPSIKRTLAAAPQLETWLGDNPIDGLILHWSATIAYYADGMKLDALRRAESSGSKVTLLIPASGPDDEALIQVTTIREADQLWRVSRIEFFIESAVPPPATKPTSQPS